jgi:AcrR family transcriptional regulator
MQSSVSTADRLIDAGVRLFAQRGFKGTTVGEIEEAAGLVPRRGALYRHFPSKRALLEAAIERHTHELDSLSHIVDLFPLGDLRAELTLLIRWLLAELERERDMVRILEKEGDQVAELRDRFYASVADTGYRLGVDFARRALKEVPALAEADIEAAVAVFVGAVVNFRRTQWTFSRSPLDLDDERFAAGTVDLFVRLVDMASR